MTTDVKSENGVYENELGAFGIAQKNFGGRTCCKTVTSQCAHVNVEVQRDVYSY